jgi:hypothetical protein
MTMQPHPEPQEASSLPVVALRYRWTAQPGEVADANPWTATVGMVIWPRSCDVEELTPLADAQSQLTAMRAERDEARALLKLCDKCISEAEGVGLDHFLDGAARSALRSALEGTKP